jgi:hypothetical protein
VVVDLFYKLLAWRKEGEKGTVYLSDLHHDLYQKKQKSIRGNTSFSLVEEHFGYFLDDLRSSSTKYKDLTWWLWETNICRRILCFLKEIDGKMDTIQYWHYHRWITCMYIDAIDPLDVAISRDLNFWSINWHSKVLLLFPIRVNNVYHGRGIGFSHGLWPWKYLREYMQISERERRH